MILLIHPPVAKPCEAPAGLARIVGVLRAHGVRCKLLDANLEGLFSLLNYPPASFDSWTNRAFRNRFCNLNALRNGKTYQNLDQYKRAVRDLNRVLQMGTRWAGVRISLANYQHPSLSPLRSQDLIRVAEQPEENPFFPYFQERLSRLLESDLPSAVGFSLNYLSQGLCGFAMIGFLKREYPRVKVVAGGGLITSWMRSPDWHDPFQGLIDICVAGPGEEPVLSLMGREPTRGGWCPPDYTSFPMEEYLAPGPILPYSASSGCYWNRCSFCPERAEGNPYHPVPANRVIEDLALLVNTMKPHLLHFLDNALSLALLETLGNNPPGVPWYGFARVTRQLSDMDFCEALKRSGCVLLKLGLESGDQGVLDNLGKGINLRVASQVLRTLKKVGIATYVYLLFGTPPETLTGARNTLAFVAAHSEFIDFLNLALFNLPAYGPDAATMQTRKFYQGDLSLYVDFSHPQGWDRRLVREFLDREFKRHPPVAAILKREPPVFTSNHAPFFV